MKILLNLTMLLTLFTAPVMTTEIYHPIVELENISFLEKFEGGNQDLDPRFFHQCIVFTGFPECCLLKFSCKRLMSPKIENLNDFRVSDKGNYILTVSSQGYVPGERVEYFFDSKPNNISKKISFFPNPLTAKSTKKTFTLEAELVGAMYILTIPEAKLDEEFTLTSVSYDESQTSSFSYAGMIGYDPRTTGKDGGTARLKIVRKSNQDEASLDLMWGSKILEYFMKIQTEGMLEAKLKGNFN